MAKYSRRRVLRGMLNGGAVSVSLPFLNCFLNSNGTAQASGAPMPVRFGTWFWGLGATNRIFVPSQYGHDYDVPVQLAPLKPVMSQVNLISNLTALRDASRICATTPDGSSVARVSHRNRKAINRARPSTSPSPIKLAVAPAFAR